MAQKLKPGGYLYMVSDWEDYACWALAELSATENLANAAPFSEEGGGFALPQGWRPKTAFEKKGLAKNHMVRELFFKRI
jgi:tRNA (guanine-N7-)-methyltransferase